MTHVTVKVAVAVVVCATLLSSSLLSQTPSNQPPPSQTIPTFRSSVQGVQLSVVVTDDAGRPVTDLVQDDFEISENGLMRPVTTFAAVNIPIETTPGDRAERDVLTNNGPEGRTYVIALDDMTQRQADQARPLLHEFMTRYFGPNDRAAVVWTTCATASRSWGQEFTTNRRLLLDAIDHIRACEKPPLGGPALREKYVMGGLHQLVESLAKTAGRKAVIFVSARGLTDYAPDEALCGCDARTLVGHESSFWNNLFLDMNHEYYDALSAATRGNVAFYPISPSGTTGNPNLVALAAFTGGFTPNVSTRSLDGFDRLVRDLSSYYLLGFNAGEERQDGRYVSIEVTVKRPGLHVRSLNGYVAPRRKPEPEKRPPGLLAGVWDAVASPLTMTGVPMRVFAAPFKGAGKNATVEVSIELDATKLNLEEKDGAHRGDLEIAFAVTDIKQKKWPIWRHRATVALLPETYERVSRGALRVIAQVPLPEGRYQLRTSAGGAILAGSVVYDLTVPNFRDDFAMSGVTLTSAQARQTFTVSPHARLDVAFPGPPTTAREFTRDDTLTVFAELYENRRKPHVVTFSAELRDESGIVLVTRQRERAATTKPKETSVYRFVEDLALVDVPAGRYVLHVEGRSTLDKEGSVTHDVPLVVRESAAPPIVGAEGLGPQLLRPIRTPFAQTRLNARTAGLGGSL